jgi:hypothetical protein
MSLRQRRRRKGDAAHALSAHFCRDVRVVSLLLGAEAHDTRVLLLTPATLYSDDVLLYDGC